MDERVNEEALFGSAGGEALVVFRGELLEIGGTLAADDSRFGIDAGFERVHGGCGFSLD